MFKKSVDEFPLWLSRLRIEHGVREEAGSLPGLVDIWHFYKRWSRLQTRLRSRVAESVAWAGSCNSHWTLAWNFHVPQVRLLKKKKRKEKKKSVELKETAKRPEEGDSF